MDKRYTTQEAAEYLGLTANTLRRWRMEGYKNLSCLKVGRNYQYKKSVLDEYLIKCEYEGG